MRDYHEKTRQVWDEKAEQGWGEGGEPAPYFLEFYKKHKPELGNNVLDVGSGKGRYLIPLAQDGFRIVGLEPSEGMITTAKAKIEERQLSASLVHGESVALPFGNKSFDFVLSIGAIHHNTWDDIQKSFAEVSRILRDGKLFLFQGRSVNDTAQTREPIPDTGYTAVDQEGSKEGVLQHYFTKEELLKLAVQHGFDVAEGPTEVIHERGDNPGRKSA